MPELFLEIGAEEIPSRFMSLALGYLEQEIPSFLKKNRNSGQQTSSYGVAATPSNFV